MSDEQSTNCELCFRPSEGEICQLCFSIVNENQTISANLMMNPNQIEDGLKLIPENFHSNKNSWNYLARQVEDSDDVKWARKYGENQIHRTMSDRELKGVIKDLKKKNRVGRTQLRKLANGFILSDGSRLSVIDGKFALDGRTLSGNVPLITVLELIADERVRQNWNIKQILVGLSAITSQAHQSLLNRPSNNPHSKNIYSLMEWILESTEHCEHESFFLNQAWARDVKSALGVANGTELYTTLMNNRPNGLLEAMDRKPWLYRWLENKNHTHLNYPILKDMVYSKDGRLRFRKKDVNNKQSSILIPSDPRILSFLISMYLSPIDCKASQRLLVVRENWNNSKAKPEIKANVKRSIEFMHSIIEDGADRVEIIEDGILIRGMAGHYYLVNVGKGAHGAPYQITGMSFIKDKLQKQNLCIYNDNNYTQTPLGDHLGSAILALLNDVISARTINSLSSFIISQMPVPGFGITSPTEMREKNPILLEQLSKLINRHTDIYWLEEGRYSAERDDIIFFDVNEDNEVTTTLNGKQTIDDNNRSKYKDLLISGAKEHLSNSEFSLDYRNNFRDMYPRFNQRFNNREFRNHMRRVRDRLDAENLDERFRERFENRIRNYDIWIGEDIHRHERRDFDMIRFGRKKRVDQACFIGDPRFGQRRYCDLAVRYWNLLLGLRETCRFHITEVPTIRGERGERWNVKFNDCGFKFTIRSEDELDFFSEFASQAGWESDESFGDEVWTKVRAPNPSARNRLSVLLNRFQREIPEARTEPWWWEFTDPSSARDLWGNIPWEMEEDLRDEGYKD